MLALVLSTASTAGAAGDIPPTLAEACGSAYDAMPAHSFWAETGDGVRLYMIEAGNGATTLVLAHGGRSDLCDTLTFAGRAIAAGYRIVAFDFRGNGRSESPPSRLALGNDLAAAVAHARQNGAKHIFLIGSSMGGAAIVQNTSALRVDGRISLSGTRLWPGFGINDPAGLARIRAPVLYVGSRNDWRAPLREALGIFRRIGARDKRTALYPGSDHGWQLVDNARFAPQARVLVLSWIASHL